MTAPRPPLLPSLRRFRIGPRLALSIGSSIALFLGTTGALLFQAEVIRGQAERLGHMDQKLIAVLGAHARMMSLYDRLSMLVTSQNGPALAEQAASLRAMTLENARKTREDLAQLSPEYPLDPSVGVTLEAIEGALPAQLDAIAVLARAGDWSAIRMRLTDDILPVETLTSGLADSVGRQVAADQAAARSRIQDAQRRIRRFLPLTVAVSLLVAGALGIVLTRSITEPLRRLVEGSRMLAGGHFEHEIPVDGDDELSHLGSVFNETSARLRRLYEALRTREAYLAEAQGLSLTGSFGWKVASGELVWSEQTYWIVGLHPDARPTIRELLKRVHPDDEDRVRIALEQAVRESRAFDLDHRLLRADGSLRHVRVLARPSRDGPDGAEYVGAIMDVTALKQSQRDLEAAYRQVAALKEELGLVVDTTPAMIHSARPDGYVDFLNKGWLDYVGLPIEVVRGWGWADSFHPDDVGACLEKWRAALASGEAFEAEGRVRRADGQYRLLLHRKLPLRDKQGAIVKWYGSSIDIEDRKRAEQLLLGANRLLETVAQGHSLAAILDGVCRLVEETFRGSLASIQLADPNEGRLRHAARGSLPRAYVDVLDHGARVGGDGAYAAAARRREAVTSADIATDPLWAGHRDAALAHGIRSCWCVPVRSSDGNVLGVLAIHWAERRRPLPQDHGTISQMTHVASIAIERNRTEEALAESEERVRQMADSVPEVIWITALNPERVLYTSPSFERIWGIPVEALYRDPRVWTDAIHTEDRERVVAYFSRWVAGDDVDYADVEFRIVRPDGGIRWIHERGVRVTDERGKPYRVNGISTDITERKAAEDVLGQLRTELAHVARVATLGELTASIAHEVNQPLSAILTNAGACLRLLAADPPDIRTASETERRTIRDAKRAADVIARLRALFRKKRPEQEVVDVNEAIREVLALTRHEMQKNRVMVHAELASDLPAVRGDRVQLQQVVLNLVINAAEAMAAFEGRYRQITINTRHDGNDLVRITVRDTGPGLPPGSRERIFDAFYTNKDGGMGMGLSIARSIVEGHGGRIWVEEDGGVGATIVIRIPGRPTSEAAPSAHTNA